MEFELTIIDGPQLQFKYETDMVEYTRKTGVVIRSNSEVQDLLKYIQLQFPHYLIKSVDQIAVKSGVDNIQTDYKYPRLVKSTGLIAFLESGFQFAIPHIEYLPRRHEWFPKKHKEIDPFFDLVNREFNEFMKFNSIIGQKNDECTISEYELYKLVSSIESLTVEYSTLEQANVLKRYQLSTQTICEYRRFIKETLVSLLQHNDLAFKGLEYRVRTLQNYEDACKNTQKKALQMSRLQSSSSISQPAVDLLLQEMLAIKVNEAEAKDLFRESTIILKRELDDFRRDRDARYEMMLDEYVDQNQKLCKLFLNDLTQ